MTTVYIALLIVLFVISVVVFLKYQKDEDYKYNTLDIIGIVLNIILFLVYSFFSIVSILFGLVPVIHNIVVFLGYIMPFLSIICIMSSVILRRKEYRLVSFLIQFIPLLYFGIMLLLDEIL